jgi:phosphoglycerate kinase
MSIRDLTLFTLTETADLRGKRVIVRLDLNLPVNEGAITDHTRLDAIIPFIKKLSFAGAKIIILSHFGEKGESIQPIADILTQTLPNITFIKSIDLSVIREAVEKLPLGNAILLENVRLFPGETENVPSTARDFASLGDIFVNDAFSVSHRAHASVVGVPNYLLSYFGPTCLKEIEHLTPALTPEKPALLIIGGAKISTKLALIKHYLDEGVRVFVGGAMSHNILRARGYEIGKSLYDAHYEVPESVIYHPLLVVPSDVVLESKEDVLITAIPKNGVIVDCGKKTLAMLDGYIASANTIIVNGPLGLYEKGWLYGTEHMLTSVAEAKHARTYIGGGDTLASAENMHVLSRIGFVSLGGGALLEFLASGTLAGIDAVIKSHQTA